jgi:hypothetical protein
MQLHSPEQRSTDDASLVQLLLERETMMRLEAKAETDELRQEMEKMRESHQFLAHELSAAATDIAETDDDLLTAS